ncbi:Protein BPS1, chloroplastic [Quillaja saponaria]|uniref:Protein BPS1, chloroplastic n=1 Tax=Quillaja saponaria TaxID=32244 RepID=A0AAD7PGT3_QUISA|nr:Protein BPS1, chloroplastic [Quillaja saponaria]
MAVDFLSFVHTEARSLISNMKFSDLDGSLALYLDESVKILDICNSVSWEIEQLSQRRLLLNFVLHLLNFSDSGENLSLPAPEKLRKARDSLCGWDNCSSGFRKRNFLGNLEVLIRDLALGLDKAPCERISSVEKLVRRTVHAVRMVTVFIAGVLISSLHGLPEVVAIRVPAEFLWADSFNELESTISGELKRRFRWGKEERTFRGGGFRGK